MAYKGDVIVMTRFLSMYAGCQSLAKLNKKVQLFQINCRISIDIIIKDYSYDLCLCIKL